MKLATPACTALAAALNAGDALRERPRDAVRKAADVAAAGELRVTPEQVGAPIGGYDQTIAA